MVGRLSCSRSKRKTLQERIGVKVKVETIGEARNAWQRDGKRYADWRPEVMVACRAMRCEFDERNPVVGADFVSALSLVYDKHADEELPPGILASKVIDYCERSGVLWPPDFQAHGDRLRRRASS